MIEKAQLAVENERLQSTLFILNQKVKLQEITEQMLRERDEII